MKLCPGTNIVIPLLQSGRSRWLSNLLCWSEWDFITVEMEIMLHCTCFHCGISLKKWESQDDVVLEQKKWAPECKYLRMACDI